MGFFLLSSIVSDWCYMLGCYWFFYIHFVSSLLNQIHLLLTIVFHLILLDFSRVQLYHLQTIIWFHSLWFFFSYQILLAGSSKNKSKSQWVSCRALSVPDIIGMNLLSHHYAWCWNLPWEIPPFCWITTLTFPNSMFPSKFQIPQSITAASILHLPDNVWVCTCQTQNWRNEFVV